MYEMKIKLDTVDKVKSFAARAAAYDGDLRAMCDAYTVDGKSIMGLFSLDLSKEITLKTDSNYPLTFAEPFKV